MFHRILTIFFIVLFIWCQLSQSQSLESWVSPQEDFKGTWKGEGKIIVSWCKTKQLSFKLQIDIDGNVFGEIGDTHVRYGKMRLNNIIYRWLGNSKYIIDAELSDFLIKKEKIKRESIRIFLDFQKPFLTGGFHTSGRKFGGKEKMVVSGRGVKLVKIME